MYTITYVDIERSYDWIIFYTTETLFINSIINSNISVEYDIYPTLM